jgi:hypothetical protein
MSEYPAIDPKALTPLRIIQAQLIIDPAYLDAPDCPYSPELCSFLRIFGENRPETTEIREKSTFFGENADKWAFLENAAAKLYEEIRGFGDLIGKEDVAERMSWFRTTTALLEKVVLINERAVGLKRVHEFQQLVLDIFDSELPPDLRTRVMDRLRAAVEETPNG